jgi:SAM-dependent methyltransferase
MNGGEPDRWSDVAAEWSRLWGDHAAPAWRAIAEAAGVGPGTAILDVGCGAGELLAFAVGLGAIASGSDPAPGMLDVAASRLAGADLRPGGWEHLPWPDGTFDLVVAVNSLQFAEHQDAALAEARRVTRPGGRIAIANWAEAARNDLDRIEAALAEAEGEEPIADAELRLAGGLERVLAAAGLHDIRSGLVEAIWLPADDDDLVRGVLLGEDDEGLAERAPTVLAAAAAYRVPDGGYRLVDAFRWAVGVSRA